MAERESRGFRPTASTDADVHALKKTGKKPEFASESRNSSKQSCYRCGEEHDARCCRYRKFECHLCKRMGHLARMGRCKQPTTGTAHYVNDGASGGTELLLHGVYLVGTEKQPYEVELQIAGKLVKMQVDTGAAVSLVPECVYRQLKQPPQLAKCDMKLKSYGGATLKVKGQAEVLVDYKGQRKFLPIIVVPGDKPALLDCELDCEPRNGPKQHSRGARATVCRQHQVFQAIMDELLKGLPGVVCYLDDVLITGASHTECLARVDAVLQVFMEHGVKCSTPGHPLTALQMALRRGLSRPSSGASSDSYGTSRTRE
ncbi:uncharacterized protein LOC144163322 [Haemaphysalis longicornis]